MGATDRGGLQQQPHGQDPTKVCTPRPPRPVPPAQAAQMDGRAALCICRAGAAAVEPRGGGARGARDPAVCALSAGKPCARRRGGAGTHPPARTPAASSSHNHQRGAWRQHWGLGLSARMLARRRASVAPLSASVRFQPHATPSRPPTSPHGPMHHAQTLRCHGGAPRVAAASRPFAAGAPARRAARLRVRATGEWHGTVACEVEADRGAAMRRAAVRWGCARRRFPPTTTPLPPHPTLPSLPCTRRGE